MVHRKLNMMASHRANVLRNLITSLFEHESIVTTHAKAKEAQTYAERVITNARKLAPRSRASKQAYHEARSQIIPHVYKPDQTVPKLFGELAERYKDFNGGYTRVLHLERRLGDNAPQSILELVNGPRDMRMSMTARVVARYEQQGTELAPITKQNVKKICRDEASTQRFRDEVQFMKDTFYTEEKLANLPPPPHAEQRQRAPIQLRENPLSKSAS